MSYGHSNQFSGNTGYQSFTGTNTGNYNQQPPDYGNVQAHGASIFQSNSNGTNGINRANSFITGDQLSFLTTQDQQKFLELFQNSTNDISISPESARTILLKTNLNPHYLAKIWELSDINKTGDLLFPEFALALHLCNTVLRGGELPFQLDPNIKEEVTRYVDKINFGIPEGSTQVFNTTNALSNGTQNNTHNSTVFQNQGIQSQPTGYGFQNPPEQTSQFIFNEQSGSYNNGTQSQDTGLYNNTSITSEPAVFNASLTSRATGLNSQPTGQQFFSSVNQLNSQQTGTNNQNQNSFSHLNYQPTGNQFQSTETGQPAEPTQPTNHQKSFPLASNPTFSTQSNSQTNATSGIKNQQTGSQGLFSNQLTGANSLGQQQSYNNTQPPGSIFDQQTQNLHQFQSTGLQSQNTGAAPLRHQQTGLVPLQGQQTGTNNFPQLNRQATGLVPLQGQATGSIATHQTGGLTSQQTGINAQSTLANQPTGLIPLPRQATGGIPLKHQLTGAPGQLEQQPTGLVPLQTQATGHNQGLTRQPTGLVPLQAVQTGGASKLTQQPTGLVPLQAVQTGSTSKLTQQPTGLVPLQSVQTGGASKLTQQPTGLVPLQSVQTGGASKLTQQPTGLVPLQSTTTGGLLSQNFEPLKQQKTGVGQNSFFLSRLIQQDPSTLSQSQQFINPKSLAYTTESITPQEKQLFNRIFENFDTARKGLLTADVSAEIFRKSGLNREDLETVWDLITNPNQTHLDKETFQTGMWLVYKRLNGYELPETLPESLRPSSLKILDDVKNKLKHNANTQTIKKSSNSRLDGSRFKNNDDELITSSSRHRRRRTTTDFNESTIGTKEESPENGSSKIINKKLTIEELKKQIWEKQIIFDALEATEEDVDDSLKFNEVEDLKTIEKLKEQLKNLPAVKNNSDDSKQHLKQRLNSLASKVPTLLSEISSVDNEVTRLKLDLYKVQNPSSILGSGPNGEITDSDRKKAKSKALLAEKMAKLTGKPLDPEVQALSEEEAKLSEEVIKIQEESKKNQQVISDVKITIDELYHGITSVLRTNNANDEDYKKWELGVGVQPEVQEIIKSFKVNELSNRYHSSPTSSPLTTETPSLNHELRPSSNEITSSQSPPLGRSSSNYKTAEERKLYIREQAKKKMNERLAKFGISRTTTSHQPKNIGSPTPTSPSITQIEPSRTSSFQEQDLVKEEIESNSKHEESSSDDEDEEEYQRLEEIRRQHRRERELRIANQQHEEIQNESSTTSSPVVEKSSGSPKFHKSNPFARN